MTLQTARLLCLWDSSDKNTGVGCHALLLGIFPTQRLDPALPLCRRILYHLSHQRSRCRFCKYFLPVGRLPFHFVNGFLCCAEAFYFAVVIFVGFALVVSAFRFFSLIFIWLCHMLAAARWIFNLHFGGMKTLSCGRWDLVP